MNNILYKRNIITAAIIVVVLFVSVILSIYKFFNIDSKIYDNDIRMIVSRQKNEIEKGMYHEGSYPYIVFGLDGRVLYNGGAFDYKVGELLNTQEMIQTDKSFSINNKHEIKESFVLENEGKVNGFVVFLIPEKDILIESNFTRVINIFSPVFIGVLISAYILIARTLYFSRRILTPLKEISVSTKGIIAGNYDLEIIRTYEKEIGENEVGDLTYSFELMRDELKAKQIREEVLKKSQQELISCISHDLKTPISTIKAYSEGLRDGIARTPKAQENYVNIIIGKTDLLIDMISELLEYSNAELNQLDINIKEIYFYEYFIPVMKELEVYVKQKDIDFSYEVNTRDMLVCIDKRRITEVLYNLVENSIKYMKNGRGSIIIEAEMQNGKVLIKVKDNGIGISPDDMPYVFDKFYRAEKSRSSSIPGSGLGLSICKYIIEEHGGEIYCKSRHSNGCEFGFTLK
ncbi:sensor histidine kinase [Clostridium folliculivorans]|uniref:histidine kinase n=1 Tax=Clostridium folliculivorans TaxID=2886038 RepID=A0A9W5Y1T8_9CLOT|nr:HAMP domain-containing sensor histidine kinase [Clostridium folliculivorans]GKU25031.1 two-component sensor histidine kinase [Clostridium folliculivorans]GKU31129.1 two-component sensor histidine kinase [Clostridium folliculivorans]